MHRLGYAPNAAAQSMRTKVSRTIGFMVPDLTNYPNAAVAKAAEATLADAGYYMLLTDSDYDPRREQRFLRLLRSRQVDGIILYLSDEDDPEVQRDDPGASAFRSSCSTALCRCRSTRCSASTPPAMRAHGRAPGRHRPPTPRRDRAGPAHPPGARAHPSVSRGGARMPDRRPTSSSSCSPTSAPSAKRSSARWRRNRAPTRLLVDGSRLLAAAFEVLRRRRLAVPRDDRGDRDRCGRAARRGDAGGDRHRARFQGDRPARRAADDRSSDRRADRPAGHHRAAQPAACWPRPAAADAAARCRLVARSANVDVFIRTGRYGSSHASTARGSSIDD